VPGNTIIDAVATVRDAIAYAETVKSLLCALSLDFNDAFNQIAHTYLLTILRNYGFIEGFIERIQTVYENVRSIVQVSGHISTPISIQCGVRQGCPLNMILFALCLNPVIQYLEEILRRFRAHGQQKTAVIANADVSILVTSQADVQTISVAITCYEKSSGVVLNFAKIARFSCRYLRHFV
jgi:hypothetical protein